LMQRRTGFRSPIFGLERLRRGNNAYPAYRSPSRRPIVGITVVAFLVLDLVLVYALIRDDDTFPRGPSPLGLTDRSGSSEAADIVGRDGTEVRALTLSEEGQDSTRKPTQEQSGPAAHASGGGSHSGSGSSATVSSTSTSTSAGTSSSGGSIGGSSSGTGSGGSASGGSGSGGSGSGGSGSGGSTSGGSGSSSGGPGGSGGGGGSGDGGGSSDGGAGGAGGGGG
jgi:hypothetical protein